jgi:serine/threonine-protein kinase
MIRIEEEFCLPADVEVSVVADMDEEQRERIQGKEGQVAFTRRRVRSSAKLVDGALADFLLLFRTPRTIADAINHFAEKNGIDWEGLLEQIYPKLRYFINERILVSTLRGQADNELAFATGDAIDGYTIERTLHLVEDTQVYLVRSPGGAAGVIKVLKLERERKRLHFERELAIFQRLPPGLGPALLGRGVVKGHPYLLIEWFPGPSVAKRAFDLRRKRQFGMRDLLVCCLEVLQTYARLHEAGILHGDVHPQNIRCESAGVRLIDFGLSRLIVGDIGVSESGRGGVAYYMEPEQASALLAGDAPPAVTPPGEQYSVAALVYEMLVGKHPTKFVVVRNEMLRQILEESPLPLTYAGACPLPNVEIVLRRALEKAPERRFPSMARMTEAFAAAIESDLMAAPNVTVADSASDTFIDTVTRRLELRRGEPGALLPAPRCSVANGAAGAALGLHQIACARDDAALFALADLWAEKAANEAADTDAFTAEPSLTREVVGHISPYHTMTGVWYTRALLASDRGDAAAFRRNTLAFVQAIGADSDKLDLTLGLAGCLLATALLRNRAKEAPSAIRTALDSAGSSLFGRIIEWQAKCAPVGEDEQVHYAGIAHGWSGILYALLVWCRVSGTATTPIIAERVAQLAAKGEPARVGVRWPVSFSRSATVSYFPSWCNGSGGFMPFWLEAATLLNEDRYLQLAIDVGENGWDETASSYNLCCGVTGQAYGFLALYNKLGEQVWLDRARQLGIVARDAVSASAAAGWSLHKGALGVAVLLADLGQPRFAAMPLFTVASSPRD